VDTCINVDREVLVRLTVNLILSPKLCLYCIALHCIVLYYIVLCLQDHCRREKLYSGTTAVGAIIDKCGQRLTVFNIGDSQAVICRDGVAVCFFIKQLCMAT
jgi:hypothetical protein